LQSACWEAFSALFWRWRNSRCAQSSLDRPQHLARHCCLCGGSMRGPGPEACHDWVLNQMRTKRLWILRPSLGWMVCVGSGRLVEFRVSLPRQGCDRLTNHLRSAARYCKHVPWTRATIATTVLISTRPRIRAL
jgi:hypothetical protein